MRLLAKIRNKLAYERDKLRWKRNEAAVKRCEPWQSVATMEQTLETLIMTENSMCRYGDGEYKVMAGMSNGFQCEDAALAERLRQVLRAKEPGIMVCIPNIQEDMQHRTDDARNFWKAFIRDCGRDFSEMLCPDIKYYNAHVTRLYMDYQGSGRSEGWFASLKQVWQGKRLLIVEGEHTKLGVGNDLFCNAESVRRVLCPSKSAFAKYDEILQTVRGVWNGELVLIALGQTATILAYDLHCAGIRALDIGHIDIEYEWFLAGATEKTAVTGKFVKEVDEQLLGQANDQDYCNQIVARVGVST